MAVIDWARMERHARLHKIATWGRMVAVIVMAPEVYEAFKYHFPWWDDAAMPLTITIHCVCRFIQKHTEMYRIDI